MPSIFIKYCKGEPETMELKFGELTIGRNEDNDVRIKEPTVSGHHAKIYTFFNASYVEDQGSTNGTKVNGKIIKKHTLHSGDVITVGKCELIFNA